MDGGEGEVEVEGRHNGEKRRGRKRWEEWVEKKNERKKWEERVERENERE